MNDKIGKCPLANCTGVICLAAVHGCASECPNRPAPKPEAQAVGEWPMTEAEVRQWISACNHEPARQVLRDYLQLRALSTPASHDAQHEAVTEHEGEFGLPPLPASAVYWRQRAEFWREQAVLLGWREKRDAENGEAQQPAVVGDGATAWKSIDLLPDSDDLFWFLRWDSVGGFTEDGPRPPQRGGYDADEWTWFAPVESPPFAALTPAASGPIRQASRTSTAACVPGSATRMTSNSGGATLFPWRNTLRSWPHRRRATAMADVTVPRCMWRAPMTSGFMYFDYEPTHLKGVEELVLVPLADYEALRQACWDARAILGFDNNGDPTPAAMTHPTMADLVLRDAREVRENYDGACEELFALRKRCEAVEANYRFLCANLNTIAALMAKDQYATPQRAVEALIDIAAAQEPSHG